MATSKHERKRKRSEEFWLFVAIGIFWLVAAPFCAVAISHKEAEIDATFKSEPIALRELKQSNPDLRIWNVRADDKYMGEAHVVFGRGRGVVHCYLPYWHLQNGPYAFATQWMDDDLCTTLYNEAILRRRHPA